MKTRGIGCKKCGRLISFNANEIEKQCPHCGTLLKDEVTCLACMYTGTNADFNANNCCPKCNFKGLARTDQEAQVIADNLRRISDRMGKVQVAGMSGKMYVL